MHAKLVIGLLAAAAVSAACSTAPTREGEPNAQAAAGAEPAATRAVEPAPAPPAFRPGVELPAGPGRDLLVSSCLGCHDLTALPLFAPFYTRDSWRTLVATMQAHGADVDNADIELLADYLAQHFGSEAPPNAGRERLNP